MNSKYFLDKDIINETDALSFYKYKNHFGPSKLFWSGPNHFGQVQITLFWTNFYNLDPSKTIGIRPK